MPIPDGMPFLAPLKAMVEAIDVRIPLESNLARLLETLAHDLNYSRVALAIINPERNVLKLSLTHDGSKQERDTYLPGEGVSGQVLATGKPMILSRIKDFPDFLNYAGRSKEEMASLSFICVPIADSSRSGEQRTVLGVLSVDLPLAQQEILEQHRLFLEIVAGLIYKQVASLQEQLVRTERQKNLNSPNPNSNAFRLFRIL